MNGKEVKRWRQSLFSSLNPIILAHNKSPHDTIPKKNARVYSVCVKKKEPKILIKSPIIDNTIATTENAFTVFCLNMIYRILIVKVVCQNLQPT